MKKLPNQFIPEEEVHDAMETLRASAEWIGAARADMVEAEYEVKRIEAFGYIAAEGSQEARKAAARVADRYKKAVTAHAKAFGEFEKIKAKRESAIVTCECWRTQQATLRGQRF